MDKRKPGIYSLNKTGCYFILSGAVFSGVFGVISLFVKFNIARHDLLTLIFFGLCIFLSAGFYVAIGKFEDPDKMLLEFHPPKAIYRDEILRVCEEIYKHHNKTQKLVYVIVCPLVLGLLLFGIAKNVLDPSYFLYHLKAVFTNIFLLPALFSGTFIFFIWGIVYRNRIDEIRDGAYAVAEVDFVEKYYCVHTSAKSHYTEYFVILADTHGNKGRFKVSESEYYRFHTGTTVLLVKRSKGKLFYNATEPVALLVPVRFHPDM